MHAPQLPTPQPNLVPVNPRLSRNTQSKGVSGATSTCCATPLTFSKYWLITRPFSHRTKIRPPDCAVDPKDIGKTIALKINLNNRHAAGSLSIYAMPGNLSSTNRLGRSVRHSRRLHPIDHLFSPMRVSAKGTLRASATGSSEVAQFDQTSNLKFRAIRSRNRLALQTGPDIGGFVSLPSLGEPSSQDRSFRL